jgi:hypothetical protein
MKKKLIIAFLFVFLCITTFFIYRTLIFIQKTPIVNIENKQTTLRKNTVENLSNAIKHKVITNTDLTKNNYTSHDNFWTFLRETYPEGSRVELISMEDPYNRVLHRGSQGTVKAVDDAGTIHVSWDEGSSLGLVYGVDSFKKL